MVLALSIKYYVMNESDTCHNHNSHLDFNLVGQYKLTRVL